MKYNDTNRWTSRIILVIILSLTISFAYSQTNETNMTVEDENGMYEDIEILINETLNTTIEEELNISEIIIDDQGGISASLDLIVLDLNVTINETVNETINETINQTNNESIINETEPETNETITNTTKIYNSSLVIYDSTDFNITYPTNITTIYANYTNETKIISIANSCLYTDNSTILGVMHFDINLNLHVYETTFQNDGTFNYNVNCYVEGFDNKVEFDTINISHFEKIIQNDTNTTENDNDNDGYDIEVDCDDNNPNINPGMSEILYNSIDDDCNPATLDYINLEIVTNKQNYIPNEQVMVTVAAPPGSDTYLTIDSPTNFSYVYIFNDATYPLQQLFTFTGKSGTYNIEAINTYDDFTVTKTNHFEVDNNLNAILNFENNYFEYENIKFTPSISGGVGALSYLWDFGDGTQSTELNPSHTYSTAGKYHVILIILDSEDNDFSIVKEIKIKESYDVKIKVKNNVNGSPIDDAKVRFDSLDNYTNETGDVVFRLSNETYELKVTHSDYDSYSEDIQINGSDEISVSLVPEDNSFPPLISLLYPDDGETFSSSPNLEFKVNDEQNTNCTLYISQGDGWWSEEETKTGLVPNTNYEFNIELDEGTYFWKLECIDVEEIEVFSATREFTIDNNYVGSNNDETNNDADNTNSESGARASSSNVNNNSKEEINETYTAVSEVLDLLPDFSLYSPEQRKVIELLNFDDRIKDLKKDLEKANRDLFNLRYKDNAIDVLDERNALLSQIEEIKNSIPMVLVIEKDNEYVKYINDEDAIELLELYIESKNIEMSKGEKKDFIETNLLLQKKVTVNTRGYNVHIEYMTGRKEDITIIAKRLDFNPIYDDMKIVEFIPKEVITNTDEISFLFEDYEIINKDPMFEISKETKDYSYYINRKLALEVLPQVKTLLITNEIEKSGTLSGITGFAVLDKVGISENSKKIFFVQIIIIFILSGIFIYNNLKYSTVPINGVRDEMLSNFDSNIINKINELISEITILIDSNLLYDAGMKYTELKVLFRDLSINLKDQFYDNIAEKCHHINQRYVSSMIDEAFIHLGNEDYEEALSAYEVINKEYKNLDPKTREEIYPKCCELVALINS